MEISKSTYKDIPAVKIETPEMTALFLPEYGGKLASLVRRDGRELLQQDPGERYRTLAYGGDYVEAECSAFDDMFPTIDKCYCQNHPWEGYEMPDHGEVCGLAWRHEIVDGVLKMWVHSPKFGYVLRKRVTEVPGGIRIDYKAENLTQFEFDFVYAAHCMIAAEEGAVIEVPYADKSKATLTFDTKGAAPYGSAFAWKENEIGLSITPSAKEKYSYKIYFDEKIPRGRCCYAYKDGTKLAMEYSADKLPYLGIWYNWGDLHGLHNFAFEPCSGSYDRPDIAKLHGQSSTLPPYGKYEWSISFLNE